MFQLVGLALVTAGFNLVLWIVGIVISGFSSGIVWTNSFALIVDVTPEEHLSRNMGFPSIALVLGVFLGPLLGGVLYDNGGYYAVFGLLYGLIGVDLVVRMLLKEPKALSLSMAIREEKARSPGEAPREDDKGRQNEPTGIDEAVHPRLRLLGCGSHHVSAPPSVLQF